jgi:hypothetical protein
LKKDALPGQRGGRVAGAQSGDNDKSVLHRSRDGFTAMRRPIRCGAGGIADTVSAALHAGGNQAAGLLDERLFQVSTRAILKCQLELYGKREFEGLVKIAKRAISKSCGPARLSGTATELQPTRVTASQRASGANPIRKTSANIQRPDTAHQGHAALARSSTRSTLSMRSRGGGSWLPNCPSFRAYLISVLESRTASVALHCA